MGHSPVQAAITLALKNESVDMYDSLQTREHYPDPQAVYCIDEESDSSDGYDGMLSKHERTSPLRF